RRSCEDFLDVVVDQVATEGDVFRGVHRGEVEVEENLALRDLVWGVQIGAGPALAAQDGADVGEIPKVGVDAFDDVGDVVFRDATVHGPQVGGGQAVGDDVSGTHDAQEGPLRIGRQRAVAPQAVSILANDRCDILFVQ